MHISPNSKTVAVLISAVGQKSLVEKLNCVVDCKVSDTTRVERSGLGGVNDASQ